jgi:hypothetical protein
VRRRVGDVLDHDVEVHLPRDGRVRPGRRTMVRSELEREAGGRLVSSDDYEIVACVGDRMFQECGENRASLRGSEQSRMRWCRRPRTLSMVAFDDRNCGNSMVESAVGGSNSGRRKTTSTPSRRSLHACP